jgi:hypothetical protein
MDGKNKTVRGIKAFMLVHREEVGDHWENRIVAPDYSIDHAREEAELGSDTNYMKNFDYQKRKSLKKS